MARVVITRPVPEAGLQALWEYDVFMHELAPDDRGLSEDALVALGCDADALITVLSDPVTARVIEACPKLRIIAQYAVGYDNVDLEAARGRGVVVTNTPGVLTDATADMAFALLLAVTRRIVEADRYVRVGRFVRWQTMELLGMSLQEKTLGIVGMGRIGQAVGRRARAFGMKIVYHSRSRLPEEVEAALEVTFLEMEELARKSDVITLHCPLNAESRHLIDASMFSMMKPSAVLINTARGAVVDETAMIEALEQKRIAGAGLDVFEWEPDVPERLKMLDNVVLAPHLGSATIETRTEMARLCAESVRACLQGGADIPRRIA